MSDLREHHRSGLVLLARVGDPATARVLAARLQSEGIEVHLRGEWLGPYAMHVGSMAESELWVPSHALEDSRLVMMAAEVDALLEEPEHSSEDSMEGPPPTRRTWILLAAALLAANVVVIVLQLTGR
ncbi:MAG: hypothetical protein M3N51_07345 [Actinomycetota bacterium]|nr:hypothetical protein [Actinomycetota bacterium]